MVASKKISFDILDKYFSETPDEEILEDIRKYCPELEDPNPAEVTRMPSRWRRITHILFGR